jgi:hypothetical protein
MTIPSTAKIIEDDRELVVSTSDADRLVEAGLCSRCSECGALHHEEYERWDEIDDLLRRLAALRRRFFGETR